MGTSSNNCIDNDVAFHLKKHRGASPMPVPRVADMTVLGVPLDYKGSTAQCAQNALRRQTRHIGLTPTFQLQTGQVESKCRDVQP